LLLGEAKRSGADRTQQKHIGSKGFCDTSSNLPFFGLTAKRHNVCISFATFLFRVPDRKSDFSIPSPPSVKLFWNLCPFVRDLIAEYLSEIIKRGRLRGAGKGKQPICQKKERNGRKGSQDEMGGTIGK
jgi:hypothetical protein